MSQARVSPSMNSCSGAFSSVERIEVMIESSSLSFLSPAMSLRETERGWILFDPLKTFEVISGDMAMRSQSDKMENHEFL